uniref:Uncharacterized protein n=1 Tax=Pseudomonas phage PMBT23 TaxID=3137284 RepID=A0AAU8BTK3_9VIRU
MSLIDLGRWGFFVPVPIGEIYHGDRIDSPLECLMDRCCL